MADLGLNFPCPVDIDPPPAPRPVRFMSRSEFPAGFVFGAGTSAYQIEGDADERGKCIWDDFAEDRLMCQPGHEVLGIKYWKEDVKMIQECGFDAQRISISWARVLPKGTVEGGVNEAGVSYYRWLLTALLDKGIQPYVTLLQFDLPQALQDRGGFMEREIVGHFQAYADFCFNRFGDLVTKWVTINEPWSFSYGAYARNFLAPALGPNDSFSDVFINDIPLKDLQKKTGKHLPQTHRFSFLPDLPGLVLSGLRSSSESPTPPAKRSHSEVANFFAASQLCKPPDPSTAPYIVSHYQILAHAYAVKTYREKYKATQNGEIGFVLVCNWAEPYRPKDPKDRAAALRALDFQLGWFLHPVVYGTYPETMIKYVGDRLPKFEDQDIPVVKGSIDFLGFNYYTASYVQDGPDICGEDYVRDPKVKYRHYRDRKPIGPVGGSSWLYVYPEGIMKLLLHIKSKYKNPTIYITENGIDEYDDGTTTIWKSLYDYERITYHHDHLYFVQQAMKMHHVKVKGYFVWSLMDNFEWTVGCKSRFGVIYVDYRDSSKRRIPKSSLGWFGCLLGGKHRVIGEPYEI